jgi:ABC-type glutathione transport system ATPase component
VSEASVWQVTGLHKAFRTRRWGGALHRALDGADLTVAPGERVGIIGESGSGKTTLARVGLGLVPADAGTIRLFGEDTATWSRARWRRARERAQLLFQDPRAMLHPGLRLGTLLRESVRIHRPEVADPTAEVAQVLDAVGLAGREGARPHELSGGERRRAGLARVLLARPELLVADEPTAGLDADLKAELVTLVKDRVGPRCAIVLVSHDLPMVAWACDRVVVMDRGRVVDRFAARDLQRREPHPRTAELLHAAGLRPAP